VARARSLSEFQTSFPDETSCAAFLFQRRWPQGFVCPACGGGRAALLKSRAHTYECLDCGRQTSITAGTAMHRSKLPLTVWFWAAHLMATHSNGMSAVQLEAQLGITYKTAWLLAQKLRRSMVDPQREPLEGVVEVDQAELPFRADNSFFDPLKSGKILIAGAVEVIDRGTNQAKVRRKRAKYLDTRSGRIRLAAIPDNSAASIEAFVRANVKTGTTLLTDGHRSYPGLADYRHDPRTVGKMAGHVVLPWIHRVFADEALGARHLSWAAPQTRRHLPQRVCLPIQSALLPARLVRDHARARRAPSPDELLGYRRTRQSPQRRADGPARAAATQDSDRHAGRPIKASRKSRTQSRFGFGPPALDIDQPGTTG
jgi:predicted RNA-binding Zn-ribbon protein involved in translation (DUF1610 family)